MFVCYSFSSPRKSLLHNFSCVKALERNKTMTDHGLTNQDQPPPKTNPNKSPNRNTWNLSRKEENLGRVFIEGVFLNEKIRMITFLLKTILF